MRPLDRGLKQCKIGNLNFFKTKSENSIVYQFQVWNKTRSLSMVTVP